MRVIRVIRGEEQTSVDPKYEGLSMFHRHKSLSYQGYSFPWYVALIWICFLVAGVAYLVKHILFE